MAFLLPQAGKDPLQGLLTNVTTNARNVAFDIQFNNLQNTVIGRLNKEVEDVTNSRGNQRKLDELTASFNKLGKHRSSIIDFAKVNEVNGDRFQDISTLATSAYTNFTIGGAITGGLIDTDIEQYETFKAGLGDFSKQLVELSHADFIDGNSAIKTQALISRLEDLTPQAGIIDDEGTDPATNDNLEIKNILRELTRTAAAGIDTSTTLQSSATRMVSRFERSMTSIRDEMNDINVVRAGEIEYEVQMIKAKHATFLRSIEIAFDASSQATDSLLDSLNTDKTPPLGSILSILS